MKTYEYRDIIVYGNYMEVIDGYAELGWRVVGVLNGHQFGYRESQNIILIEREKNEN